MTIVLRCPFCSHEDVEIDEVGVGEFAVDCPECRAIGPIMPTVMEAIIYWNDRRGYVGGAYGLVPEEHGEAA